MSWKTLEDIGGGGGGLWIPTAGRKFARMFSRVSIVAGNVVWVSRGGVWTRGVESRSERLDVCSRSAGGVLTLTVCV